MTSFVVTIDTEEEGLWSSQFSATGNKVTNLRGVPRFQALCEEYDIRPTYLIDAPVVEDDWGAELFREYARTDKAEIGAHCHPWCNPPFVEETTRRNSYLCNLPAELQHQKLQWLTEAIQDRIGQRPTSFRAGRYGLDHVGLNWLEQLGYQVDSSVIPFSDFSSQGGPDFSNAPLNAYHPQLESLLDSGPERTILEVPVSVGYNRGDFRSAHRTQLAIRHSFLRRLRVEGILDRLGWLQRIKLSPEQATAAQMLTLLRRIQQNGQEVAVLMFHSTSLVPGFSPYVPTSAELDSFLERLRMVFAFVRNEGLDCRTLSECAAVPCSHVVDAP